MHGTQVHHTPSTVIHCDRTTVNISTDEIQYKLDC